MFDDDKPHDAPSLAKFMAAMEAYKDKAVHSSASDDGPGRKTIAVRWLPRERVQLIGGEPGEWGFVAGIVCRVSGCLCQVAWPHDAGTTTDHWEFELEDAPDAPV